jgi:hypothetical protein
MARRRGDGEHLGQHLVLTRCLHRTTDGNVRLSALIHTDAALRYPHELADPDLRRQLEHDRLHGYLSQYRRRAPNLRGVECQQSIRCACAVCLAQSHKHRPRWTSIRRVLRDRSTSRWPPIHRVARARHLHRPRKSLTTISAGKVGRITLDLK